MAFSRLRSPIRERHLLTGAAGVSDKDCGSSSSQDSDGVAERPLPRLIRPIDLPLYIYLGDEVEVEEGEYVPPLSSDDDEDDDDGSVFQFEDGEVYPLSSDEEGEDEEALDDSGYDTMSDEDDDIGLRSPLVQQSPQQHLWTPRRRAFPPIPAGSPDAVPAGAPVHLHPPFGIRLLFLRD